MTPQIMELLFELIRLRTFPVQHEGVVHEAYRVENKIMKLLTEVTKESKG